MPTSDISKMPGPILRRLQRFQIRAASGFAMLAIGALCLQSGNADADIICTFGDIRNSTNSCNGSVGNVTFSNFTISGIGYEDGDQLIIEKPDLDLEIYQVAVNYRANGATTRLSGNGPFGFTATASPTFFFTSASANADTFGTTLPPFTFTNKLTGISPDLISVGGAPVGPQDFTTPTSTTNVIIEWAQGGSSNRGNNSSLSLYLNNQDPVPGPLPLTGAVAAFGFSRKIRKRIKARLQATLTPN